MEKKITFERISFLRALNNAGSLAANNKVTPIVECVKITASDDSIIIRSTDTENFIKMLFESNEHYDEKFEFCINKAELSRALTVIHDDTVTLELDEHIAKLIHSRGKINIPTYSHENFPSVTIGGECKSFDVSSAILAQFLSKAAPFISTDNMAMALNGIYLYVRYDKIGVASTNKSIIYIDSKPLGYDCGYDFGVIVNPRSFKSIIDMCSTCETVRVDVRERTAMFVGGNTSICSRLVDGKYPPFEKIIPTEFTHIVSINKADFADSINRISISTSDTHKSTLEFTPTEFNFTAEDIATSKKSVEKMPYSGSIEFKIGANVEYLAKAISAVSSENIELKFIAPQKPMVFGDMNNPDQVVLVMPMLLAD